MHWPWQFLTISSRFRLDPKSLDRRAKKNMYFTGLLFLLNICCSLSNGFVGVTTMLPEDAPWSDPYKLLFWACWVYASVIGYFPPVLGAMHVVFNQISWTIIIYQVCNI